MTVGETDPIGPATDGTDRVVDLLNHMHAIDPNTISHMYWARYLCNNKMAEDERVIVKEELVGLHSIGMLGVINSIMDCLGHGRVAAKIDDDGNLLGFTAYKQPQSTPTAE